MPSNSAIPSFASSMFAASTAGLRTSRLRFESLCLPPVDVVSTWSSAPVKSDSARQRTSSSRSAEVRSTERTPASVFALPTWSVPVARSTWRSEEHTSELQSRENLVCRLLLEKKKKKKSKIRIKHKKKKAKK